MAKEDLLERQGELAAIEARLAGAVAQDGGLLVIEGPAGIGKTALLRSAIARAQDRGLKALSAWAAPLEQDLSFGVVREIFEPVHAAMTPTDWVAVTRGAAGLASGVLDDTGRDWPDSALAAAHGLYWLTVNLANIGPLVVTVDDVQWADAGSLRWLAYLARRLEGLPVLVVVTVRSGEAGGAPALLTDVLAATGWEPVRPAPLGEDAAADLVRRELQGATTGFCRACHSATGGNPFLLRALAVSLRAEGIEPNDMAGLDVAEFGPESVAVALERRLAALPAGAGPFLEAIAVIGSDATLRHCAALAGLSLETAATVADALTAAGVLVPPALDFVHPVVRSAVTRRIGIGARGLAHGRAARLLAADGVPPDRLAPHLLQTHPAGEPWVVSTLRAAARTVSDRGTPDTAEVYLRRALAEPPGPAERPLVLHELGMALSARRDAEAPVLFHAALAEIDDTARRGEVALAAARACNMAVMLPDAAAISIAGLTGAMPLEPATALRLEAEMVGNAWMDRSTAGLAWEWVDRDKPRPATGTSADALALVLRAIAVTFRSGPAAEAVALLREALTAGLLEERGSSAVSHLIDLLIHNDELDTATRIGRESQRRGQEQASGSVVAHYGYFLALATFRCGALTQAESEMRSSYEFNRDALTFLGAIWALSQLVEILCAAGDLGPAERELTVWTPDDPLPHHRPSAMLLESRGVLRAAQGRHDDALADLQAAGCIWTSLGITNPNLARWRAPAACALARAGKRDEAHRLAGENLDLARATGLPRAIGVALHTIGVVDDDTGHFVAAAEVLRGTEARLELARVLVDLGAALRRSGQRTAARERLGTALDIAHRCGAKLLAEQARAELRIAGGRPRRPVQSGVDALTPQERRVTLLAAEGLSNREVAERLFVSERTVETHLLHVFQKLGITSRAALLPLLTTDSPA